MSEVERIPSFLDRDVTDATESGIYSNGSDDYVLYCNDTKKQYVLTLNVTSNEEIKENGIFPIITHEGSKIYGVLVNPDNGDDVCVKKYTDSEKPETNNLNGMGNPNIDLLIYTNGDDISVKQTNGVGLINLSDDDAKSSLRQYGIVQLRV